MAEFDRAVEADIALASKVGKASDPVDASLAIAIDRVRAGRAMDNPQAPVTLASWRAWGR